MSGQPIFSNATLDDTDVNKPVFSSLEAKKISDYSPTYSSIAVNGGKIELTFNEDLATISSFDANSFVIKEGATTYPVNEVTISNKKVTIGTNHTHSDINNLTVQYTKPSDLTKAIKTSNGIELEELKIVNNVNRSGEFPKPTTVVAKDYGPTSDLNSQILYENFETQSYSGSTKTLNVVSGGRNANSNYSLGPPTQAGEKWIVTTTYRAISLWHYFDSRNQSGTPRFFEIFTGTNGQDNIGINISNKKYRFFNGTGSGSKKAYVDGVQVTFTATRGAVLSDALNDGSWHHIYYELESTRSRATFGGLDEDSPGGDTESNVYGSADINAKLDDVRFFNAPLTNSQIADLAAGNNGSGPLKKEYEITFNENVEGNISSDDFVVKTTSDNTVHQPLIAKVTNDKVVLKKGTITRHGLVDGTLTGANSWWSDGTRTFTSSSNHGGYTPNKAFDDLLGINIWHSTSRYSLNGVANTSTAGTTVTTPGFYQTTTYQVGNSGATSYDFTGGAFSSSTANPNLTLLRGKTYEFVVNSAGHPFRINTTNTTGTGSEYSSVTPYDLVSSNSTLSGQTYSGSSQDSTVHPPSGAFNGVTEENAGAWVSIGNSYSNGQPNTNASTNGYDGEWVQVDVGQMVTATTFKFYTRNVSNRDDNDAKKMRLFSSNDGNTWTQVYDWTNLTTLDWRTSAGGTPIALTINKTVRARYFRIAIGELMGSVTYTQLAEFEVIGFTTGVTNNGTENGTITFVVPSDAPNTLYYNCEHHGGMSGTITITNPDKYVGEWLQVDLGSSATLHNFEILPREFDQFKPKDFKLFGKTNATDSWTEIYEVTGLTASDWKTGSTHHSAGSWDIDFTGRYFRLAINKVVTGAYVCVGELILRNITYSTLPTDPNTVSISYTKSSSSNQNLKVKGTTTAFDSFLFRNGNHIKSFTVDSPVRPSGVNLINNDGSNHGRNRGDLNKIIDNNINSQTYTTTSSTSSTHGPFILEFDFPSSLVGKRLNSIQWKWSSSETGTLNGKFGIRSGSTNTSLNVSGASNIGSGTFNTGVVSTWDNSTDWHIDTAVANDNATVIFDGEYTIQSGDTFLFRWFNSLANRHFNIYNLYLITENVLGTPSIVDTTVVTFNKVISGSDSYSKNDFTIKQGTTALSIKEINISNNGKLLITTNEEITDANTLDIVYKKNSNVANHLKDNNNKKVNSFRIKNNVDIKPIVLSFNQNIASNQNVDENDFTLRVDGITKGIHDVIVMEEGKLLIRPEQPITDINKVMITYEKSATSSKNIANSNGDSVLGFTYHNVRVSKKTEGSNEILQVSGTLPEAYTGNTAVPSPLKRTIYIYSSDTTTSPSYTGANRPVVKISDYRNVIVDSNVTATITVFNNTLLVNGKPAYQYSNDANINSATGDSIDNFYFFISSGQSKKVLEDMETAATNSGIQANDIALVKNKRITNDGDTVALSLNQPLQSITDEVEKRTKRHAVLKLLFSSNPLRKQFKIAKQELSLNAKITKQKLMVIKSGETINLSNNSPIDENTGVYANLSDVNDSVVFNTGSTNITFTKLANNNYSVTGYNNLTIITRTGDAGNWKDGDSSTFDGVTYYFGGISTNGTDDTPGEDFVQTTVTVSSEKDGSSGLLNHLNKRTASMNSNTTQKEIKKHQRNFSSSDYLLYKKLRHFKK